MKQRPLSMTISVQTENNHNLINIKYEKIKSKEHIGHTSYQIVEIKKKNSTDTINLFFLHDIFDSTGRYQHFFQQIEKRLNSNINIIAIDLVGMGQSSGHRGYVSSFDHYCLDVINIMNAVNATFEIQTAKHQVLMGVGLGGLVALHLLEQFEQLSRKYIDGIILVNPLIRPTFKIPAVLDLEFTKHIPRYDRIRFNLPYNGVALCDDLISAALFDSNINLQKFITISKAREILLTARKVRAAAYFINKPALMLSSDGPLNDQEAIDLFHKGLNNTQSRHFYFKNCGHDILNGRRQSKAYALILNWLDAGKLYED